MSSPAKKLILVIGATGAQGIVVIDALLAPSADGSPSPYAIRAFTRDPTSSRAQDLAAKGAELVQGSFDDFPSVYAALKGVYGVWNNTDGFTVGEMKETYAGIRIFEMAKELGTVRHYVWSNLDYSFKKGGYKAEYRCNHHDGKARVGDWMKAQESIVSDTGMSWSCVSTSPYMEMLKQPIFGPLNQRADGTFVFAAPIGKGHVPMVALKDVGFWARYTFDNRALVSRKDLEVASDWVDWEYLVETFRKVTGQKAVAVYLTTDEWMANFDNVDQPVANEKIGQPSDGSTTWRQNFTMWWAQWRGDVITRDFEWIRKVHPGTRTVESWMRENNYTGKGHTSSQKNVTEGKTPAANPERTSQL